MPVDVLQSVPWSALHGRAGVAEPVGFLLGERAATAATRLGARCLLAAGPGLPAAEEEVRRLSRRPRASDVLSPPESTVSKVAEALEDADIAHFACHGVIRADNPMFSGLLLSDGYLTVQELELRDLAPHRVVLAACEASADVAYTGGELLGFVSALIARGTAGVLGSIQLVPDEATAQSCSASTNSLPRRGDPGRGAAPRPRIARRGRPGRPRELVRLHRLRRGLVAPPAGLEPATSAARAPDPPNLTLCRRAEPGRNVVINASRHRGVPTDHERLQLGEQPGGDPFLDPGRSQMEPVGPDLDPAGGPGELSVG